jgi:hypothetical protein
MSWRSYGILQGMLAAWVYFGAGWYFALDQATLLALFGGGIGICSALFNQFRTE